MNIVVAGIVPVVLIRRSVDAVLPVYEDCVLNCCPSYRNRRGCHTRFHQSNTIAITFLILISLAGCDPALPLCRTYMRFTPRGPCGSQTKKPRNSCRAMLRLCLCHTPCLHWRGLSLDAESVRQRRRDNNSSSNKTQRFTYVRRLSSSHHGEPPFHPISSCRALHSNCCQDRHTGNGIYPGVRIMDTGSIRQTCPKAPSVQAPTDASHHPKATHSSPPTIVATT